MSIFDLTDFERQGQVENDIKFDSLELARELCCQIAANASRSIRIYTPDLEPGLYNEQAFNNALLNIARGNRHARIQILILDTSAAIKRGHRLLQLAQTLTSAIDIRIPLDEYQQDNMAFMLGDNDGFIYRPDTTTYQGIYNPSCKVRAQKLSEIFTLAWEHAEHDPETRRLRI